MTPPPPVLSKETMAFVGSIDLNRIVRLDYDRIMDSVSRFSIRLHAFLSVQPSISPTFL